MIPWTPDLEDTLPSGRVFSTVWALEPMNVTRKEDAGKRATRIENPEAWQGWLGLAVASLLDGDLGRWWGLIGWT